MSADPASPSLRIFVVENHADTLRSLQMYLEQMGHLVFSARTMETALEALPLSDCDVLISDIGLPDGTGWELMERLALPRPIFAIAISGFGVESDKARSREAGFHHHMTKPADPDELDAFLAEAVPIKGRARPSSEDPISGAATFKSGELPDEI